MILIYLVIGVIFTILTLSYIRYAEDPNYDLGWLPFILISIFWPFAILYAAWANVMDYLIENKKTKEVSDKEWGKPPKEGE